MSELQQRLDRLEALMKTNKEEQQRIYERLIALKQREEYVFPVCHVMLVSMMTVLFFWMGCCM